MNSRKSKQRNKCRKNIVGFKKLNIKFIFLKKREKRKKWKKKEKRKTPQNCKRPT